MAPSIVVGEIDRISGSGNAMLRTKSEEYNLGPLPRDLVGNPAIAAEFNGTWAFCLTPYIDKDEYLSDFCSVTDRNRSNVKRLAEEALSEQSVRDVPNSLPDHLADEYPDPPEGSIEVGDSIEVQVTVEGPETSYIFFTDGTAIEVDNTYLPAGTTTTLEIVETDGTFSRAKLDQSVLEKAPEPETSISVTIETRRKSDGYSIRNEVPIILPNCPADVGESVRVAVESVQDNGVEATVIALSDESRPKVGDVLDLELDISGSGSTETVIHDGIPIEITQPSLPITGSYPVRITDVKENSVSAHVDFDLYTDELEVETNLTIVVNSVDGSNAYSMRNGVPIVLPNCPVSKGESVRVAVEAIQEEGVIATMSSLPTDAYPSVGDVLDFELNLSKSGSATILDDGIPIEITQPALPVEGEYPVIVTDIKENSISAHVDFAIYSAELDRGTILTVEVETKHVSNAYAMWNGIPISLPDCAASEGERIRVAVESFQEDAVEATVAALPADSRPVVGDILDVRLDYPTSGSTISIVKDRIPLEIEPPIHPIRGTVPIEVAEVNKNSVFGHVDFSSYSGLSEGDDITLDNLSNNGELLVGWYEGVPITIPISGEIPEVPDSLPVTVTEIFSDRVAASITCRPEVESLEKGKGITVPIETRNGDYLIGSYKGIPVWISFEHERRPDHLTVGIKNITDCGIYASIPELPDSAFPEEGDVVPAQIDAINSESILATLVGPENGTSYALPVSIPVSLDVSGTVGVEVVSREESNLTGIIRTPEVGGSANPIPKYLQEVQRAVFELRDKRFKKAATAWESAAATTESDIRRAESLRSWAFAVEEASHSDSEVAKSGQEPFNTLLEELGSLRIPDGYRAFVSREVEIYRDLASITVDDVPDSVNSLQRIAYTVDSRSEVNKVAGRLRNEVLDLSGVLREDEWEPCIPHPLLLYRLRKLCEDFESPPENTHSLLKEAPHLESVCWSIPPNSDPEPIPDETIGVHATEPNLETTTEADVKSIPVPDSEQDEETEPSEIEEESDRVEESEESSGKQNSEEKETDEHIKGEGDTTSNFDSTNTEVHTENLDTPPSKEGPGKNQDEVSKELVTDRNDSQTSRKLKELRRKAEESASKNPIRDTSSSGGGSRYQRAPAIRKYVKARADGVCEACGELAPFDTPDGEPYLETHHVNELGRGGEDHPDKVVAICPTCHKRIHYGEDGDELNEELRERLENGLADVGTE